MTLTCQLWLSKKNLVVPEAANEVEQFTHCNKPSFARARLETCCYLISKQIRELYTFGGHCWFFGTNHVLCVRQVSSVSWRPHYPESHLSVCTVALINSPTRVNWLFEEMSVHYLSMIKVALEFRPRTDFKPEHFHGYWTYDNGYNNWIKCFSKSKNQHC